MLYSFRGADGANLYAGLLQARDGNFYGTTKKGGKGNQGTIFRLSSDGKLTTLYSFTGTNGANPSALIQAQDGSLYGTTENGGAYGLGTSFSLIIAP